MEYTKKVLKNGVRIITISMKGNPTAAVLALASQSALFTIMASSTSI